MITNLKKKKKMEKREHRSVAKRILKILYNVKFLEGVTVLNLFTFISREFMHF